MASLRDIFRYVNPGTAQEHGRGDNAYSVANNSDLSDPDFYAQLQALQGDQGSFDYSQGRTAQGDLSNNFNIRGGSFLDELSRSHPGAASMGASPYSEGSPGNGQHLSVDASKLPRTRFGDVSRSAAVDQGTDLINPSMAYDDPNYGRITSLMNVQGNSELAMMVQAMMAAASAGIGAAGGLGVQAVSAGRSLGSGGNPMSSLAGLAGGALGIDPSILSTVRGGLSLAQLAQSRGRSSRPPGG